MAVYPWNQTSRAVERQLTKHKDFPETPEEVISKPENKGITNSLQLFQKVLTPESRIQLSRATNIRVETILRLSKLVDLCRIGWVNHTFAFILLETGYKSAKDVAAAEVPERHKKVNRFIDEKKRFKARIWQHDIKLCAEAAKDLSFGIRF